MAINSSELQNISGTISAFACFLVCLTYFVFKDIRNLRYVELVFYVAINDFVANIGMALGGSATGSGICWFQAIVTNVQYLTAMFWTTVIAYQLWLVVDQGKTIEDMTYIHIFVWLFPIFVTFLPLSTNTFGNADDESTWCFISNRKNSPSWGIGFWDIFSFYFWVWLSTITSFTYILSSWYKLRSAPQETEQQRKAVTITRIKVRRLVLYPVVVSFCWIVSTVTDLIDVYSGEHVNERWINAATFLAVLQGVLFSCIFFIMNPFIRHKWVVVFEQWYFSVKGLFFQNSSNEKQNSKAVERRTMGGRETVSDASSSSFAYSVEEEPDYIGPRSKGGSLNDAIEMKNTYTRSSLFSSSSFMSNVRIDKSSPSASAIRNPVARETSNNTNIVNETRDSEMSVDIDC